jgi:hypothetical protein
MEQALQFEFWPAVIAGIAGGSLMSVMMAMARAAGTTTMNISLIQGAYFTDDRKSANAIGLFMHIVVMSGLVFGSIYAALYAGFEIQGEDAWWWGLIFGAVHAVVAGIGMAMMPMMHPKIHRQPVPSAATGHDLEIQAPGLFGANTGKATPVGLIMTHLAYGVVVGLVYAALV